MTTEHFTAALQLTYSFDPSVSPHERLQAERYLMELREQPDGLNLSFHIINNEPVNEIRCFWAFNTIMHHLPLLASTVDATQATELYRTLFAFIYRYFFSAPAAAPADYIVNKHAQMMVVGLQEFYPTRWTTIFEDLFDMLHRRQSVAPPSSADVVLIYVLRVFEYVDERVVCVRDRQERGRQQRARDMELKDAMRRSVMPRIVDTWYHILSETRLSNSDVAKLCLSVVQTYVEWVDVNLFMKPDWIYLLYYLLTVPALRISAMECLLSLVEKKQLPGMKIESLNTLNVMDAMPRMITLLEVPPATEEALLFLDAVAKFTIAVATQLLGVLESCAAITQQSSGAAVTADSVVDIDGEVLHDYPVAITDELLTGLLAALHGVVGHVLYILSSNENDVRETALPFLQTYLKTPHLTEAEATMLMQLTFQQSRVTGVAADEDRLWDDSVIDQRKLLYNTLRLLHRRYPELVMQQLQQGMMTGLQRLEVTATQPLSSGANGGEYSNMNHSNCLLNSGSSDERSPGGVFVGEKYNGKSTASAAAMQGGSTTEVEDLSNPEALEAALRLLFELGETLRLDCLRDAADPFTLLLQRLLTTEAVVAGGCTSVHLAFFEVMDRYYLFFTYHPQYIPLLLQRLLLQPCGVMNRSDRVRARVSYLFGHLLQVLKGSLGAYAADMVVALHSIVTTAPQLLPNDRRELYEAVGILLSICSEEPISSEDGAMTALLNTISSNHQVSSNPIHQTNTVGDALVRVLPEDLPLNPKAILVRLVVDSAVMQLKHSGAICPAQYGGASSSNGHVTSASTTGHPVADAISYLSSLARGLGSVAAEAGTGSPSATLFARTFASVSPQPLGSPIRATPSPNSTGTVAASRDVSLTSSFIAQLFVTVTTEVMAAAEGSSGSSAVRDGVGQYYHQLVNMVPYEVVGSYVEDYVPRCLQWMETVPELGKLLRLMLQYVNKASQRGVYAVARMTPPLWQRLCCVGELNEASPVVVMGVLSESARERINVYKQFFSFLLSTATWGCAASLALLPSACFVSILEQLRYAITLPAELELPRSALQVLQKMIPEFNAAAQALIEDITAPGGGGVASGAAMHLPQAPVLQEAVSSFAQYVLQQVTPTCIDALLAPEFDLSDAKNYLVLGDVMQVLHVSVLQYRDAALQALYHRIVSLAGDEEASLLCAALRDSPRVNSQLKMRFRTLLTCMQERHGANSPSQ